MGRERGREGREGGRGGEGEKKRECGKPMHIAHSHAPGSQFHYASCHYVRISISQCDIILWDYRSM